MLVLWRSLCTSKESMNGKQQPHTDSSHIKTGFESWAAHLMRLKVEVWVILKMGLRIQHINLKIIAYLVAGLKFRALMQEATSFFVTASPIPLSHLNHEWKKHYMAPGLNRSNYLVEIHTLTLINSKFIFILSNNNTRYTVCSISKRKKWLFKFPVEWKHWGLCTCPWNGQTFMYFPVDDLKWDLPYQFV